MLAGILPARNDVWLNAAPRALIAFMCDNADIQFPHRLPIQEETHEVLTYDVRRHPQCGQRSLREQAFDMQASMAAQAGYLGGYTTKMQHVGERETRRMREATQRTIASATAESAANEFQK